MVGFNNDFFWPLQRNVDFLAFLPLDLRFFVICYSRCAYSRSFSVFLLYLYVAYGASLRHFFVIFESPQIELPNPNTQTGEYYELVWQFMHQRTAGKLKRNTTVLLRVRYRFTESIRLKQPRGRHLGRHRLEVELLSLYSLSTLSTTLLLAKKSSSM